MCFPVNKCCFCVSLETGTKIISVLSLSCWTAAVLVYSVAAMAVPPAAESKQFFYMLVAALALCQLVVCSMLVYGAYWSKPSCLWPWLVTSWISCGSLLLLSLLGVVLLTIQYYEDLETYTDMSTMSSFYFVYAAILYYCITVVQSRRTQMIGAEETDSADSLVRMTDITKNLVV